MTLKSLKSKLYKSTDDVEVLGVEGNQRGTDAVAGQGDEDIVNKGNFLALEVGASQNNSDGRESSFLPVLIGRIDNSPDPLKGPKKVLYAAYR